jgi:hypothetical protein
MRAILLTWFAAIALVMAAGCQKSTSTGPSTTGKSEDTKKLTLVTSESQSIEQGETDRIQITINRDNFNDPVTISLNDLPPGIEFVEKTATIPPNDNMVTLTLKAADDAAVGEQTFVIVAEAPGLDKNTQTVKLMVKKHGSS